MYNFSHSLENQKSRTTRFAVFMRNIREELKKTLRQVAEESRNYTEPISSSLIADAEKGKVIPSVPKLITLAKIYRIHPQRFIDLIDLDLQFENKDEHTTDASHMAETAKDAFALGDYGLALRIYEKMIPQITNTGAKATAKNRRASCLWKLGKLHWARDEYEDVLRIAGIENKTRMVSYNNLAEVFREMGNFELSRTMAQQALRIAVEIKDTVREGIIYNSLANTNFDIYEQLGRADTSILDRSIDGYKEAIRCFKTSGQTAALAVATVNLGNSLIIRQKFEKGKKHIIKGLELSQKEDNKRYISFAHCSLAKACFFTSDIDGAKEHFHKSEMIATRGDYFDLRFENNYYMWLISKEEGNEPAERKSFKTLIYLRRKIEGDFLELREFEKFIMEK